jgi:pyrophosphatase PpaX
MKLKALLFDLDGTLIEFKFRVIELKKELFDKLNDNNVIIEKRFQKESIQNICEEAQRIMKNNANKECDRITSDMKEIIEKYEIEGLKQSAIKKDVFYVFNWLKKKEIKLALVTNNGRKSAEYAVNRFELIEYFDVIITRDEVNKWKPHPEPIQKAINQLKIEPSEGIFIGDSKMDIQSSKSAGVKVVSIPTGIHSKQQLDEEDPDYLIYSLLEIITIVNNINEKK